jgi:hypothetical protein
MYPELGCDLCEVGAGVLGSSVGVEDHFPGRGAAESDGLTQSVLDQIGVEAVCDAAGMPVPHRTEDLIPA